MSPVLGKHIVSPPGREACKLYPYLLLLTSGDFFSYLHVNATQPPNRKKLRQGCKSCFRPWHKSGRSLHGQWCEGSRGVPLSLCQLSVDVPNDRVTTLAGDHTVAQLQVIPSGRQVVTETKSRLPSFDGLWTHLQRQPTGQEAWRSGHLMDCVSPYPFPDDN